MLLKGKTPFFCDGDGCQAWYHRWCVGLTKDKFGRLVDSQAPFLYPNCITDKQSREIASLREELDAVQYLKHEIETLKSELAGLKHRCAQSHECKSHGATAAALKVRGSQHSGNGFEKQSGDNTSHGALKVKTTRERDRKQDVVIYGIAECPKGTHCYECFNMDDQSATNVLSTLLPTFSHLSIKDCSHLGKYDENKSRPRPLLVQLHRANDASQILAKRGS